MKQRGKRMQRNEDNLRDLWDNVKHPNIRIIAVPEEEDKKKGHEKILEIIVENFPNQETLTSHSSNPTQREEPPQQRGTTNFQHTERPPQTQQPKQDEKARNYSAGKGT